MNAGEIKQFAGAKKKEVNQYIEQEVLEKRTPEYVVPKDRVLRIRRVLKWKDGLFAPESKKERVRFVLVDYQDPNRTGEPRSALHELKLQFLLPLCHSWPAAGAGEESTAGSR